MARGGRASGVRGERGRGQAVGDDRGGVAHPTTLAVDPQGPPEQVGRKVARMHLGYLRPARRALRSARVRPSRTRTVARRRPRCAPCAGGVGMTTAPPLTSVGGGAFALPSHRRCGRATRRPPSSLRAVNPPDRAGGAVLSGYPPCPHPCPAAPSQTEPGNLTRPLRCGARRRPCRRTTHNPGRGSAGHSGRSCDPLQ